MRNFLIPTSSVEYLAKSILRKTEAFEIVFLDLNRDRKRYFPNGEIYIRILKANKLRGKRVIVLHSGAPRPNEGLVELELILQILKNYKVKPEVFFTYFPYGMQDKIFGGGEINVAENLVEKLVNYYKVRKIYVIDPHFGGRKWVKKYPIVSISAVPLLIKKVKDDFAGNILFLSPDKGGQRRTKISGFKKERRNSFSVKIFSPKINLKGKIVAVIDDMVKTGGTLLKFYEVAKKEGAKKIIALVTHGVIPSGVLKIKKKYSKHYLTNTIKQRGPNVDITELVIKTLS